MTASRILLILTAIVCVAFGDHDHPNAQRVHQRLHSGSNHGQGFDAEGNLHHHWFLEGQHRLKAALRAKPINNRAKNVIVFVGDGMGVSTVTAARHFNIDVLKKPFSESHMSFEEFPHVAISKTYNTDLKVPDSAGTATAMMTGVKTRAGILGVTTDVTRGDCEASLQEAYRLKSILKHAQDEGKWTGLVTTTRITHATPAAAYSYSADRNWESSTPDGRCKDIARQLVEDQYNKDIRVILGGGRGVFLPNTTYDIEYNTTKGKRTDGRNLIQDWLLDKRNRGMKETQYKYVDKLSDFNAADPKELDYLMGLFEPSHMQYEADRPEDPWGEPSLAEMVEKAIHVLKRNEDGFFLQVEGGRIDHAHHATNAYRSLMDTIAFSDAVQKAVDLTSDQDTLIVVTADHSHVFTIAGYPFWREHILGTHQIPQANDEVPFTIVGYTNGPGYYLNKNLTTLQRNDLTDVNTTSQDYRQDTNVPLNSETHAGEDVAIYARGPLSHLFHGVHEQSYIAHVTMYASCVGPNKDHCKEVISLTPYCPTSSATALRVNIVIASIMAALGATFSR